MPLLIPVLIFGANCLTASSTQLPIQSQLAFLGAFLLLSLALGPLRPLVHFELEPDDATHKIHDT